MTGDDTGSRRDAGGADDEEAQAGGVAGDDLAGVVVAGKYRVQRLVATGGMGRIYLAEQLPLERPVALKVLDSRYVQGDQDPGFQKRFLLEAATVAKLSHPNTVRIFDYGRFEGGGLETYFMVMEYLEGRTLRQALRQEGPLAPARAVEVVREVARALREAHRHGIVHRDLKPSNVMLVPTDEGEIVKVLDFGIAKLVRDDTEDLTMGGKFIGSPRYMAPEQIRHTQLDGRTDLYSLGVLLFEVLTGRVPFRGEKAVQTLVMHLNDPVPPLRLRGGAPPPPELEALVLRCLAKKPDDRFADVEAFIAALDALPPLPGLTGASLASRASFQSLNVRSEPSGVDNDASEPSPPRGQAVTGTGLVEPPARRRSILPGLALAVALVAVGAGLVLFGSRKAEESAAAAPAPVTAPAPPPTQAPAPVVAAEPERPTPPPTQAAPAPVRLETSPPGAEVWDAQTLIGRTPLDVPAEAKRLTLKRGGYEALTLEVKPEEAGTTVRRALAPTVPRPPPPRKPPPATPKRPPDDMDIRTTR
jgi:serine/threonine-protein kinase